ncbi:MAG: SIS domain-containing protein [Fibrobacter sp.]|nr:SIS domain-containing protein [Fibrobacter sp.]
MNSAYHYFEKTSRLIDDALKSISDESMTALIDDCERTLRNGHKVIASGLGKNVPICEKFEGTMLSLGLDAQFLHTNSAVHGDMGMVKDGDLVIILTKSGSTQESVYLANLLKERSKQGSGISIWLLTFSENGALSSIIENKLVVHLEHEGDLWNIVPNNSTTLNLIVLQTVAIELSKRFDLKLEKDFKPNHPGGAIGASLKNV